MNATARVTCRYRVTIPEAVRVDMGIEQGDLLLFLADRPGSWTIRRIPRDPVEALRLAGRGLTGTPDEVHREFEAGWQDTYRESVS